MKNLRKYGKVPYNIAVVHGGPGAPGSMAPVAREISSNFGILEPLQTVNSLKGQLQELREILKNDGDLPIILIGSSWGAILSFIFAAKNPKFIKKLILVGSGVFEDFYSKNIMETRLNRLSAEKRELALTLMDAMDNPVAQDKNIIMEKFGKLMTEADTYDPIALDNEIIEYSYECYKNVWKEAKELRKSGKLLELGKRIRCPVVAIHGDYDPHPIEGIKGPLSGVLKDFRFILLKNCGHLPWIEKKARDKFFDTLLEELN